MRTLAIAALALAGLWGCGDKTTTPAAGEKAAAGSAATVSALGTPASGAAAKLSPDLAGKVANAAQQIKGAKAIAGALEDGKAAAEALADGGGEGVSPEQLEKLLLDLATCKVDDAGIERDCEANKAWRDARKNRGTLIKDWSGLMAGLGAHRAMNLDGCGSSTLSEIMGRPCCAR